MRTGEDGERDIRITIRHIADGRDKALDAKTIDATRTRHEGVDKD